MPQYTRAISGNINPYASDALVVDTTPVVQYALQQEAKKKAAQDALDKHLLDLQNIDAKGIRPQEQEGLMQRISGIRNFYLNNQELLKNPTKDNGQKMLEYKRLIDDAKNFVGNSIYTKEKQKQLVSPSIGKNLTSGQIDIYHKLDLPLDDPNHYKDPFTKKQYSADDLGAFQTPYKNEEFIKDVIGANLRNEEKREGKPIIEPITGQVSYNTKASYSPQAYNNILETASVLSKNPKYQNFFENEIYKTGQLEEAAKQFQNYFKRPMQPHTEDVAKAWALLQVPQHKLGTEKIGQDWRGEYEWKHNFDESKKEEKDLSLLQSFARTFKNPSNPNLAGLPTVNIGGENYKDLSGIFNNNLKTEPSRAYGDNRQDKYLQGVYYNTNDNSLKVTFNNKAEAQKLFGEKFDKLKNTESGNGNVTITVDDPYAMGRLVNSIAAAHGVKQNAREKILESIQGFVPQKNYVASTKINTQPKQEQPKVSSLNAANWLKKK